MEIPRKESMPPATPEERISALERKMRDQDALIKGLTEELLDLKSIAMRLNKVSEQQRTELKMTRPQPGGGSSTVVVPKRAVPTGARAVPPPPEPEKMDMIMQTDGTLKPEKRKSSSDYIVASGAYKKSKPGEGTGKKSELIVAEDEEKEPKK